MTSVQAEAGGGPFSKLPSLISAAGLRVTGATGAMPVAKGPAAASVCVVFVGATALPEGVPPAKVASSSKSSHTRSLVPVLATFSVCWEMTSVNCSASRLSGSTSILGATIVTVAVSVSEALSTGDSA